MFDARNVRLFLVGLGLLVFGYVLLGMGPVDNPITKSVAPAVLVGVYCVLFPVALLMRGKGSGDQQQSDKGV
jgi:hypothetical protein